MHKMLDKNDIGNLTVEIKQILENAFNVDLYGDDFDLIEEFIRDMAIKHDVYDWGV